MILVLVIVYVPGVIRGDSGDGENTQTLEGIRVDKYNVWTTVFFKETMECVDVGLDSICYKKYETMYGTERTLQACQHCPIFTIVNPVKMVDLSIWLRGPQDEDLN